jgi:ParB/RepB/Spo0J family partition protein
MITREVLTDIPIKDIKLNPNNPRKNEEAVVEVIKSIKDSEFITPIIVDENNEVLAGNTRYKAMISLGRTTIPTVIRMKGMSDKQKMRFILADNKTQEFAEWDWEKMAIFTEELLADVGFTDAELDKIMNPGDKDEYRVPVDVRENVDIKMGDLFQIGEHRILCGDASKREDYAKLIDGKKIDMIFMDPPYNINYEGGMSSEGGKHLRDKIVNDDMTEEQFFAFLKGVIAPMMEVCEGCFYICMSSKEIGQLKKAFVECGGHWQANIIWVKNTFTLSRCDWQNQYEPIMYGWNGKNKSHYFSGWRDEGNVWEGIEAIHPVFDGKKTIIRVGDYHIELDGMVTGKIVSKRGETDVWREKKPSKTPWHPNQKPINLCAKAIMASSHRGSIVLDPFCGGGSTMIAAQENSRVCYAMDCEKKYVDVVLRRMYTMYPMLSIICNGQSYDTNKLKVE